MSGANRSSLGTTLGVAAAVIGLTVAQPLATVAAPAVLAALALEGNTTNQSSAASEGFFDGRFHAPNEDPIFANFLTGPFGIWRALASRPGEPTPVLNSAPGADPLDAGPLITYMQNTPADSNTFANPTWVWNNVPDPDGGLATRAPTPNFVGVNPFPAPRVDDGPVVVSYEYDLIGNAPKYIFNPVSGLNSLMATFERRLTLAELEPPVDDQGRPINANGEVISCDPGCVYTVTLADGTVTRVEKLNGAIYVGYRSDQLPLVQPLRQYGGAPGDVVADAIEPALKAIVDWGYAGNDPLKNAGKSNGLGLLPSYDENAKFVQNFTKGVEKGLKSLANHGQTGIDSLRRNLLNFQGPSASRKIMPAKPQAISVKRAVERLSKAFDRKPPRTERVRPAEAQSAPEGADG